jgi:hypothetical protein
MDPGKPVVVEFKLDDLIMGEERYRHIEDVPETVTIDGETDVTVGPDSAGETACHSAPRSTTSAMSTRGCVSRP